MKRAGVAIVLVATLLAATSAYYGTVLAGEMDKADRLLRRSGQNATTLRTIAAELKDLRENPVDSAAPRAHPDAAPVVKKAPRRDRGQKRGERPVSGNRKEILRRFRTPGPGRIGAFHDIVAMAKWGSEKALELVTEAVTDTDPAVRLAAIEALGDLALPETLPALEDAVHDEDPAVRQELADALAVMPPARAGPVLTKLVSDDNPDVARSAMRNVGEMGYRGAIPALVKHAQSGEIDLAVSAGRALSDMGDTDGARVALERVAPGMKSSDPMERRETLQQIVAIGGEASIPYLEQARHDESGYLRDLADKTLREIEAETSSNTPKKD